MNCAGKIGVSGNWKRNWRDAVGDVGNLRTCAAKLRKRSRRLKRPIST
jgi:hypothetical protein